jgi:hypothetical protein
LYEAGAALRSVWADRIFYQICAGVVRRSDGAVLAPPPALGRPRGNGATQRDPARAQPRGDQHFLRALAEPANEGLFGDEASQTDLVDLAAKP